MVEILCHGVLLCIFLNSMFSDVILELEKGHGRVIYTKKIGKH